MPTSVPRAPSARRPIGGGILDRGLPGSYFANATLSGQPAFSRRDNRLDFEFRSRGPGGSIAPAHASVGASGAPWSARWTGRIAAAFSEPYTFRLAYQGGARLACRVAGDSDAAWETIIDGWADADASGGAALDEHAATATVDLDKSATYEIKVEYRRVTGPGVLQLSWSSYNTPAEVVDIVTSIGVMKPRCDSLFADVVKGARNVFNGYPNFASVDNIAPADSDGWPTVPYFTYVIQESTNRGRGLDPLMTGTLSYSFEGKATLSFFGNLDLASHIMSYDPVADQTTGSIDQTTGSIVAVDKGINASRFQFQDASRRTSGSPGSETRADGIRNLRIMLPTSPDSLASYDPSTPFTSHYLGYLDHYTFHRHYLIASQEVDWSDRTLPGFFNQHLGRVVSRAANLHPDEYIGPGFSQPAGMAWEWKILLANMTGGDLLLSFPIHATDDYLTKLIKVIRYGSDGVNPYDTDVANPVWPPLNSNLRVMLEPGNELWNINPPFYFDWFGVHSLAVRALRAGGEAAQAINYDGISTLSGTTEDTLPRAYQGINDLHLRMAILLAIRAGRIAATVYPEGEVPAGRIRPVYMFQYGNLNGTAEVAIGWADAYYGKSDPASTYPGDPTPIDDLLFGTGGASYYTAVDDEGLTDLVPNPTFAAPSVSAGYNLRPTGANWAFAGNAGIARYTPTTESDGNGGTRPATDAAGIPPAFSGQQVAYLIDGGSMTASFTVPDDETSDAYAFAFRAHTRAGDPAAQHVRVILDRGTAGEQDITEPANSLYGTVLAPTYGSQGSAGRREWAARLVDYANSKSYGSKVVHLDAGSTHTITLLGMGDPSNPSATGLAVFIGAAHVASSDAIYDSGMPAFGTANGQPPGVAMDNFEVQGSWANAPGRLILCNYESSFSPGGDDGGTPLQNYFKYRESRMSNVQFDYHRNFFQANGGHVIAMGDYDQVPRWSDTYATQGLIAPGSWPLVQGTDAAAAQLPPPPTIGQAVPFEATAEDAAILRGVNPANGIVSPGRWAAWGFRTESRGLHRCAAATSGGGTARLLIDGREAANGPGGTTLAADVDLRAGLHSLRVVGASGSPAVGAVSVAALGAATRFAFSPPAIDGGPGETTLAGSIAPDGFLEEDTTVSLSGDGLAFDPDELIFLADSTAPQSFEVSVAGGSPGLKPFAATASPPLGSPSAGWAVFRDADGNPGNATAIVDDDFERADGPVGNGWIVVGSDRGSISGGKLALVLTPTSQYTQISTIAYRDGIDARDARVEFEFVANTSSGLNIGAIFRALPQVGDAAVGYGVFAAPNVNRIFFRRWIDSPPYDEAFAAPFTSAPFVSSHRYRVSAGVAGANPLFDVRVVDLDADATIFEQSGVAHAGGLPPIATAGKVGLVINSDAGAFLRAKVSTLAYASGFAISGPSACEAGEPSDPFAVAPLGGLPVLAEETVSLADSPSGGSFDPAAIVFPANSPAPRLFAYTAATAGSKTLTATASPSLGSPATAVVVAQEGEGPGPDPGGTKYVMILIA